MDGRSKVPVRTAIFMSEGSEYTMRVLGQFGTGQFGLSQFGTVNSVFGQFGTWSIRYQVNSVLGQFGIRSIWN